MNISVDAIYDFHRVRTACHVASVNYFAGLLGYGFPEHDNDKNVEPMRTGYAYKNYANYHPEYNLPDNYEDLFRNAHATHHAHAPHHIQFYNKNVSDVPDVHVIEMVCDWFSANFEQNYILHDYEYESVSAWFDAKMAHLGWSDAQRKMIYDAINFLERRADISELMKIWNPVVSE